MNTKTQTSPAAKPALPRLGYSIKETAEVLGLNRLTIWKWQKRGFLKAVGSERKKIISVAEIERFLSGATTEQ